MVSRRTIGVLVVLWLFSVGAAGVYGFQQGRLHQTAIHQNNEETQQENLRTFSSFLYTTEKKITAEIPAYDDYRTAGTEKKLRTYLYPYHVAVAKKYGRFIADDTGMKRQKEDDVLVEVPPGADYYYYGVPQEYRCLSPYAQEALSLVAERFRRKSRAYGLTDVRIKFAVSSTIRPDSHQKTLRGKNANAVHESTHSYGVSFDIFFDDYYVAIPETGWGAASPLVEIIRSRTGFLLGDALRRQCRTLLAQTVTELQDKGLIYVIHEHRQKVYHVTFTEKLAESTAPAR